MLILPISKLGLFFQIKLNFLSFSTLFHLFFHYFGIFIFDFTQDKHTTYELTADFADYAEKMEIINSQ